MRDRDVAAYTEHKSHIDPQSWDGTSDINGSAIDQSAEDDAASMLVILDGADGLSDSGDKVVAQVEEKPDGGSWTETGTKLEIGPSLSPTVDSVAKGVDLEGLEDQVRLKLDSGDTTMNTSAVVSLDVVLFGQRTIK